MPQEEYTMKKPLSTVLTLCLTIVTVNTTLLLAEEEGKAYEPDNGSAAWREKAG